MILYELALETGERSADLAARARALGLTDATPSTDLTPPQAAALRSGLPMPPAPGKAAPAGAPPGGALPQPDAVDTLTTPYPVRWGGGDAPATGAISPPTAWLEEFAQANALAASSSAASAAGGAEAAPVSSLPPPPGRGPTPGPGSSGQPSASAGPPQGPGPGAQSDGTPPTGSSSGTRIGLIIGGVVGVFGLIAVVSIAAVTFLGTRAEPSQRQIDPQTTTPGSAPALAPIERCSNMETDPDGDRLVAVCAALTPSGTPQSAAAAAALTGGLDSYTSPAPQQFCPSAAKVLALVTSPGDWPTKRDRLLAERDLLAIALVKVVETGPPRWISEIGTYADTIRTPLAALGSDSPQSVWAPVTKRDASTDAPASANLEIAAALSCPA